MRAAAAFNHLQHTVDFVRAVHIHRQTGHVGQGYFGNAVFCQKFAGFHGSGNRPFNLFAAFAQSLDEDIDGRAGTDADVFVFRYEFHCFFSSNAFQFVLSSHDVFPNRLGGM